MPIKEYHKLVRDRIPDIIAGEGKTVKFKCIKTDNKEFAGFLINKLHEEIEELYNAIQQSNDTEMFYNGCYEILQELADVGEVFDALVKCIHIEHDDILRTMKTKAVEKGTFENGTYLISVEEEEK